MRYTDGRGIRAQRWDQNEIARADDINGVGSAAYSNITDLLATLASQKTDDEVVSGLILTVSSGLTISLSSGAAVSFSGEYLVGDTWGFSANPGSPFSVFVAEDTLIAVDTGSGMSNPRIDTIEIRPTEAAYDSQVRKFKDPVSGDISTAVTNTKQEYGFEFQILKGTEAASPVARASTAGWIKVAEVSVAVGQTTLAQSDVADVRESANWTTEAGSTLDHLSTKGGAVAYYTDTEPTARPDGNLLGDGSSGRLWIDPVTGRVYAYTGSAWQAHTPRVVIVDELEALTVAEIQQLQNIGTVVISSTQWGYLGDLDQPLTTTDPVTFQTVNTGQGDNELYPMDQAVRMTDLVYFDEIALDGGRASAHDIVGSNTETDLPIGSLVLATAATQPQNNLVATVYRYLEYEYRLGSGTELLTGTWRSRGSLLNDPGATRPYYVLMQRTA